ncbi:MAG: hypothetical protein ACKVS9_05880 [Phycisphaerae bacterium]
MSLDLEQIVDDWERPLNGGIAARLIGGVDGEHQLQLRVDLGLLQMFPDGRPDGRRFHGFAGTVDFVQHETRVHSKLPAEVWQEVDRELQQYNYRRLAFSGLADEALKSHDKPTAIDHLRRAVRDIDQCLLLLRTLEERQGGIPGAHASLIPSLLYNRAKMLSRLREAQDRFEEAVEALEGGVGALEDILTRLGFDEQTRHHDPGLMYLRQTARTLRQTHGIQATLRERLNSAIGGEDFEAAALLRDELRKRESRSEFKLDWPRAESD